MRLTPTELDRLTIFTAAELARRRRAKGWKLTYPEALALICDEMHEERPVGALRMRTCCTWARARSARTTCWRVSRSS